MKTRFAAAIAAISISCSAQAAVIVQNSELPSAVQSLFGSATFSSFDTTNMAAFGYMENSVTKWLIRYNVLSPSYFTNASGGSSTTTLVSGYLWLSANDQYDLTNGNRPTFTLFAEKSSPTSFNSTLPLTMSAADLTNGSSYEIAGLDANNQPYGSGSLQISGLYPCAAQGCQLSAQINLIGLHYYDFGSVAVLNPGFIPDSRSLLFKATNSFGGLGGPGSLAEAAYYVQPVPLPAGLWLLISGLTGLGTLARKRKLQLAH